MTTTSKEHLQETDRSTRDLLADEGLASDTMDPAQKQRILRRLERTLGLPPEGGPGGGGARGVDGDHARESRSDLAKKVTLPLAALAIAAAIPLAASAVFSQQTSAVRRDEAVPVASSVSAQILVGESAHVETGVAPMPDLATPTLAVENLPTASAPVAASARRIRSAPAPEALSAQARPGLAEERALIANLRAALVAHRFDDANHLLREHETVFAQGQLVIQREALRVWLLEDTGQKEAASARAKHFHESYPNSVLRSAVERRAN
jgi:hypothetical protein